MKWRTPIIWSSSSQSTPPMIEPASFTPDRLSAAMAISMAARFPLVSQLPRPYILRPTISAPKGSYCQSANLPGVTTSVWPSNIILRFPQAGVHETKTFGLAGATSSWRTSNPCFSAHWVTRSAAGCSEVPAAGSHTELILTSSRVKSINSSGSTEFKTL